MPDASIGTVRGMQAVEMASKSGGLSGEAAEKIVQDLAGAVMKAQGIPGYTLENMMKVVTTTMAENMTPQAIQAMTSGTYETNTGLPQGWFFAHGSNPNNVKLGDVNVTLGKGKSAKGEVRMNVDSQATMFEGGGGGGFMGSFFENMVLGFPINSISGPDLQLELERRNITDGLIKALAPEMKAISETAFNVGKATLQVNEAFDMAKMGTNIYTAKADSWAGLSERMGRKQKDRDDAVKAGKKIEKFLKADVEVAIDPFVAMVVGLAEIFHKLMALLLIQTVAHDKGKASGVEWFLFEYLSAWIFFRLDVPKLLAQFNIKKDSSKPLFNVRSRVELRALSEADFKAGKFDMGNVQLSVDINIASGLHTGFDTSIYLEEANLFTESTRKSFFEAMAKLQSEHKLLAIQRGDQSARQAFGMASE